MNVGELNSTAANLISSHDLGRHIAHLAENSEVLLVCGYVVVVANQKISGVRIEEEASVVEVLIRVALLVELLEGVAKGDTPLYHNRLGIKGVLTGKVGHEGYVILRTKIHHISEIAVIEVDKNLRPQEFVRG